MPQLCSLSGVAEAAVPHLSPSQARPQGPFRVGCSPSTTLGVRVRTEDLGERMCVYVCICISECVSVSLCLCICFSVSLCVSVYMCLCIFLNVRVSVFCLCVCVPVCMSVFICVCVCVCILCVCVYLCSVCMSVYLSVCLSICVCLPVFCVYLCLGVSMYLYLCLSVFSFCVSLFLCLSVSVCLCFSVFRVPMCLDILELGEQDPFLESSSQGSRLSLKLCQHLLGVPDNSWMGGGRGPHSPDQSQASPQGWGPGCTETGWSGAWPVCEG